MKIEKLNLDGKKGSIEVLDKIFSAKINNKLIANVLYKTNANYKGRHAKTKQQNEVSGPTSSFLFQVSISFIDNISSIFFCVHYIEYFSCWHTVL